MFDGGILAVLTSCLTAVCSAAMLVESSWKYMPSAVEWYVVFTGDPVSVSLLLAAFNHAASCKYHVCAHDSLLRSYIKMFGLQ